MTVTVHMSEGPDFRSSGCPKARMSKGPVVQMSGRPKVYITVSYIDKQYIFRPQPKRLGAYRFGVSVRMSVCPSYFFVRARTFEGKVIETWL